MKSHHSQYEHTEGETAKLGCSPRTAFIWCDFEPKGYAGANRLVEDIQVEQIRSRSCFTNVSAEWARRLVVDQVGAEVSIVKIVISMRIGTERGIVRSRAEIDGSSAPPTSHHSRAE